MVGSIRLAAALAVVAILPFAAAAQVRPMSAEAPAARSVAPRDEARASVISWYGELQSISGHLQRVHDSALRDPALRQAREELMVAVQRAMDAVDPELPRLALRAARLPGEMNAARLRGDAPRMQAIEHEMAQIQARFMRARAEVQRQPEIARQTREYEEMLRRRMMQVEPLTDSLLARTAELQRLLQSAISPPPDED